MPLSRYGLWLAEMTTPRSKPVAADQQRRAGRGQDAAEQRLAARGGDARGDRRLEHLAGLARVADDQHARGAVRRVHPRGGRARQREREFRGEELARDAADAVGAEQPAGSGGRRRFH